jgi:hypothetical protein
MLRQSILFMAGKSGRVVMVVVVVVVVYNLVAMLLLISMLSPLLHLPDLGLGAVLEVIDICTK